MLALSFALVVIVFGTAGPARFVVKVVDIHIKVFTFHRPVCVEGILAAAPNCEPGHRLLGGRL
jgi:hypothetical protein